MKGAWASMMSHDPADLGRIKELPGSQVQPQNHHLDEYSYSLIKINHAENKVWME
jgi:hypothetical protein